MVDKKFYRNMFVFCGLAIIFLFVYGLLHSFNNYFFKALYLLVYGVCWGLMVFGPLANELMEAQNNKEVIDIEKLDSKPV